MSQVAIYARYSSDQQRDASIEDQVRLCRERAEREGWQVAGVYTDHAISGASLIRPGIQQLLQDAQGGRFEVILAEAMDRLSRDQADIAGIFKRLRFAGVAMITLSEGEIGDLHIGLKGTMNALFLKDLADKTRRGLRGRVEAGKSGGGNSYGYDVVKGISAAGEPSRGERRINEAQAAIVRRIFTEYTAGLSSKAIVKRLNAEGVPGPSGKGWGPSTIHGNRERGTGILNNELYIGRLVWNRLCYLKDPDTGKRVSRQNPDAALIVKDVPELRIVDQSLWDDVKARQGALAVKQTDAQAAGKKVSGFWDRRRPRTLFSGLMKCGCCGGGFIKISQKHFGCAAARNKGTCTNLTAIRGDVLEDTILSGLQHHLMDPALVDIFCAEYTKNLNRLRMNAAAAKEGQRAELAKIDREQDRLVDAIVSGVPAAKVKDRMAALEARKAELEGLLANAPEPSPVLMHPKMGNRYREQVACLREALADPKDRGEAAQIIRGLIESITLTPSEQEGRGSYSIDLKGHLAGILRLAGAQKSAGTAAASMPDNGGPDRQVKLVAGTGLGLRLPKTDDLDLQIKLVAGAGFEPTTFRL
ncbi:MAG: resolvase [Hyphomicrobium sp.]|nr:MAG: resolvase [Hyphomicrobium sp.]